MTLQELFDRLALGELSQHKYGSEGYIKTDDAPAVINYINQGLTKLHALFPLIEREVVIAQREEITEYILDAKYAVTTADPSVTNPYIMDTAYNPFLNDVIRIESAWDEIGCELPLNDEADCASVYTTAWNTIQIPFPIDTNIIVLIYRAKHPHIAKDADPLLTEVKIHPALEETLAAYVASRSFVSLGNQASAGLATFYNGIYQGGVDAVVRNNLLHTTDGDSNIKLTQKGFV